MLRDGLRLAETAHTFGICAILQVTLHTETNGAHAGLLERQELVEARPSGTKSIPLDLIDPNPDNPRKHLVEIEALADNIKTFGLLQPVTVRRKSDRYELLGGHRRWSAFLLLNEREPYNPEWRAIEAVVTNADEDRAFLMLLSSQIHTRNWRPREEASALERLAISGLNQKQIGERLHKGEPWISKRLRVYGDAVLSGYVQAQRIPSTVAEEFLVVKDPDTRKRLIEQAVSEGWSQPKARAEVRKLAADKQIARLEVLSGEMLSILGTLESGRIGHDLGVNLNKIARRIDQLSGRRPVTVPSIEQARKVAGVAENPRPRRGQPQRRTKFKTA